ncbi:aspergillopepsin-F [Immersiella caudata]|uniref:Aspergillopepsin-F n=1 Tax=Immersiella caudata TaxID=314043 RepID=A0AA39WSJ3_9PEZI|nr:aspergillopepsin-F [Immersiella caudata]
MQSSLVSLLLFGLLLQWVTAAPTQLQRRTFKVERRRNTNFRGHNGPKELLKAYRKYSMPVPHGLLDAIRAQEAAKLGADSAKNKIGGGGGGGGGGNDGNSIGIVTATPEDGDIEYLSPVTIGGQTLNLDFDTGSADLWVFNTQLYPNFSRGHTLFDPSQSRTFKMLDSASFSITYGDESGAAGNVGVDTVDIGGVIVENQAVELATQVSSSFAEDVGSHGLLGLAFSKINTVQPKQQNTFFDNVLPTLAEPLFTADLRPGAVGAYEFGRTDASKFVGEMAWIPVNTTNGFWQYGTSGFAVGDATTLTGLPTAQAIADTGTTLMIVSKEVSDGYYSQVSGAQNDENIGGITFPCDSYLPDLFVDVGGVYVARVRGEDINFAQVSDDLCFGGIQPSTSPGDLQIWGDVFFKSQFVVFNGGNNTLGVAQHA